MKNWEIDLLSDFIHLSSLNLAFTDVDDTKLRCVDHLRELKILSLRNSRVTNDGMAHLANLEHLCFVDLSDLPISGNGLKQLNSCSTIETLDLSWTNVTDDDVCGLGIPSLKVLKLNGTNISDSGIPQFEALVNLELVELQETRVTDKGILRVMTYPHLSGVCLDVATMTIAAMDIIGEAPQMKNIAVGGEISNDGLADFRKQLPDVNVVRGINERLLHEFRVERVSPDVSGTRTISQKTKDSLACPPVPRSNINTRTGRRTRSARRG